MADDLYSILIVINEKIKKIEEKYPDYQNNKKWIKLRNQQDLAYKEMAKEKLKYFEYKYLTNPTEDLREKIKFYRSFINKGDKHNEKNNQTN